MQRNSGLIFHLFLILGDACAVLLSFLVAYFIRTHIDQRPFYFTAAPLQFLGTFAALLPLFIIILACFGLYRRSIVLRRSRWREVSRLFLASVVGMMAIISCDFFFGIDLFPVRVMAIYSAITCFVFLCLFRGAIRLCRSFALRHNPRAALRAIVIGNHTSTEFLADYISAFPESGFRLAGVVAATKYIPKDLRKKQYSSLKEALRKTHPDVIFQTDSQHSDYVYQQSVNHHLLYYYVPSSTDLSSQMGELELVGSVPAIFVPVTPLAGSARFIKRLMDILLGGLLFLLAALPMGIIWLIEKLSDPSSPAVYTDIRLSRYNKRVKIYKFRSMRPEYNGLTPEEAFAKMGRPGLIKKYRANGDMLEHDPRVTRLGHFLRATSLDELPQLWNVVRGDISLVGPRALVPGELRHYGDRSLLLSVKSGLTGLAQVSGRRDIGFAERRALDIYYIQNWSIWLDLRILVRTVGAVLLRKGAK